MQMALYLSCCLPNTCRYNPTYYNNDALQRILYINIRKNHQVKCSVTSDNISQTTDQRRSANYQPPIWNYNDLQSLQTHRADEKYKDRAKKLEEEVRYMMNNEDAEMLSILEQIDAIQRLGLEHRFEKDIKRALDRIMSWEGFHDVKADEKLHATALRFRILRQNGYQASQDVFKTFMDHEGKFMANLQSEVKGMLSLYEASHLAFQGENILDEALIFSRKHLNDVVERKTVYPQVLSELVSHSLELPLHRRMVRLEARWYMESYSKRKDANLLLLELAKLDFNMAQSILQTDLKNLTSWWTRIALANKLEFARDRLMESFFWSVGMLPQPQFGNGREGVSKVLALLTIIDDIYDVYGTPDELELFTHAVHRWDHNYVNVLPPYMKLCFMVLYNAVNEMAYDSLKERGENVIPCLANAWAVMCKAFLQEAKWSYSKYTPTFDEYLENAWRSSGGPLLLVHSYFLQNQSITKEALQSLENIHNLLRWPSNIFRLCNDLATSTDEIQRGDTSGIFCYMSETGVSEELAREHLRKIIDENWKNMNKDAVDHDKHPFAKPFVETAINLARIVHCTYQFGDGLGAPDARAKKRALSLIIEPVPVMEIQQHFHTSAQ